MICFRDETFCGSKGCVGKCGRQWTKELAVAAERWWGNPNCPVAFSNFCGRDIHNMIKPDDVLKPEMAAACL